MRIISLFCCWLCPFAFLLISGFRGWNLCCASKNNTADETLVKLCFLVSNIFWLGFDFACVNLWMNKLLGVVVVLPCRPTSVGFDLLYANFADLGTNDCYSNDFAESVYRTFNATALCTELREADSVKSTPPNYCQAFRNMYLIVIVSAANACKFPVKFTFKL